MYSAYEAYNCLIEYHLLLGPTFGIDMGFRGRTPQELPNQNYHHFAPRHPKFPSHTWWVSTSISEPRKPPLPKRRCERGFKLTPILTVRYNWMSQGRGSSSESGIWWLVRSPKISKKYLRCFGILTYLYKLYEFSTYVRKKPPTE